jgi:hypothetical protein
VKDDVDFGMGELGASLVVAGSDYWNDFVFFATVTSILSTQ